VKKGIRSQQCAVDAFFVREMAQFIHLLTGKNGIFCL